jgi:serine/threonine protein kinase
MYFFTMVDPAAPNIDDRASDETWDTMSRITFARAAVNSLLELHRAGTTDEPIIHRNLNSKTILVKHDNSPIFIGLDRAKIPSDVSVASLGPVDDDISEMFAPEVRTSGLGVADHRSDVYGLCKALMNVFEENSDTECALAREVLSGGTTDDPGNRCELEELQRGLAELVGDSVRTASAPPARYWTEDQEVRFHGHNYRIVSRLGSGGVGTTFKVVELDRGSKEELGTYVAKVGHSEVTGKQVLRAYRLARSHLGRHSSLSAIFEVARDWRENEFIALMTWIEGAPLHDFTGVFPLLAEELQESSAEALALRWLRTACEALDVLHRNGLIHGDISPRNMIVSGSDLVITDYDFVQKTGEIVRSPGTVMYCSDAHQHGRNASPADDIFALAASVFHVVFDHEPFQRDGVQDKGAGLNWDDAQRGEYTTLARFLDQATHADPEQRVKTARDALCLLKEVHDPHQKAGDPSDAELGVDAEEMIPFPVGEPEMEDTTQLREREVPWLRSLLQSYPGSPLWGNVETRGLDSEFAAQTYVETELEKSLHKDIIERRVRLVVLCGNAGDGKTALLQHLARRLGLGKHSSSDRILNGTTGDGLKIKMNLDGSASWCGRTADELLDEFMAPFQHGCPDEDIVHLLAINDGRLLEWLDTAEQRQGGVETPLAKELYELLQQQVTHQESSVRFINLNQRSLVGGLKSDSQSIGNDFLHNLLDHLFGGDDAPFIWQPCENCTAKTRCEVYRATRVFGPPNLHKDENQGIHERARERLFQALQAVHLRGETHITVRELRAALAYIVFGVHYCKNYHSELELNPLPYWDRAFLASSPGRQGDVLRELARFDPALEAHPQIDRYLLGPPLLERPDAAPNYESMELPSARRRAFFEWTHGQIAQVASDPDSFGLARGRHLRQFRDLALGLDEQTKAKLCEGLVGGISKLEDLPPQAFKGDGTAPFRITPRTPTETAFWVEKPLSAFRVEPELPAGVPGVERLHRHVSLIYQYREQEHGEERLRLGAELFHLLLELNDGYQLGDVSTDDTFANLSIFVQRLVRENERELFAWNPMQDEQVFHVSSRGIAEDDEERQELVLLQVDEV